MAALNVLGSSNVGNSLQALLMADEIEPGTAPSYQLCKTIYLYHPLGLKMVESPIRLAQSQKREVTIPNSPEERVREAFTREWEAIGADKIILNVMRQARIYGIASVAMLAEGVPPNRPLDYTALPTLNLSFNVFDPLNTSGSLVLNQMPNAMDFQKHQGISVQGVNYHRQRCCVILNEDPIYISFTSSAFGFVGRSVYQRALFPLKSFVQTMITDDMVSKKAGLLIAMIKSAGSIIDNIMIRMQAIKRSLLREAVVDNVLSIGQDDKIETLNMQNLDGAYGMARKDIIENIATAADMPAKILLQETFAEGFGEGTEDAKYMAKYIDRIREEMDPLYRFFDRIVQYRAWNAEFYKTIQNEFPEQYASKGYREAFYEWSNSFATVWPNLLTEPDSEKSKSEKVKLEAISDVIEKMAPLLDPENKATLLVWAADNINTNKFMFATPLVLDADALAKWKPQELGAGGDDGSEDDKGGGGIADDNGARRPILIEDRRPAQLMLPAFLKR